MRNLLTLLCAASIGCAAGQSATDRGNLELTVSELRAQARRDRTKIRELRNQILLINDERSSDFERAALPVEVRGPEPVAVESAPELADNPDELVVGVDDEGVEIVYVGEAAMDRSTRPTMSPSTRRALRPRNHDALPVTKRVGPTVDARVRRSKRTPAKNSKPAGANAEKAYRQAFDLLRNREHEEAAKSFRAFLRKYPKHGYADNALYWLGETYYDRKQYRKAITEFKAVLARYPEGNKTAAAKLKLGYCHAALGNGAKAKTILKKLVAQHPDGRPADLARAKLEGLGQ